MLDDEQVIPLLTQIFPIFTLLLGAFIGLLSSWLLSKYNQRNTVTNKIIDQYFKAREEICQKLSEFTNLNLSNEGKELDLVKYKNEITGLYYKYYDFLPQKVLNEIDCLYACLTDKKNRLYSIRNNDPQIINDNDLEEFLKCASLYAGAKYYIYYVLKSANQEMKSLISINVQTRRVLCCMNEFFSLKNLLKWGKHLPKKK